MECIKDQLQLLKKKTEDRKASAEEQK